MISKSTGTEQLMVSAERDFIDTTAWTSTDEKEGVRNVGGSTELGWFGDRWRGWGLRWDWLIEFALF